jgi:hypothetical protein
MSLIQSLTQPEEDQLNTSACRAVECSMMIPFVTRILAAAAIPMVATSCMTTYDASGNPVQSVDPAAAAVGVAAAAAIGYAVANNRSNNNYYYGRQYYQPRRHCYY